MTSVTIREHVSLVHRNTFGFEHSARRFATANGDAQLVSLLDTADAHDWPVRLLGGGSNIVLIRDLDELVIRLEYQDVTYRATSEDGTLVTAGAGLDWHTLVSSTLDAGLAGLENLSLIPGTVGAAPVQNIGAYGVELADRMHSLRAWHRPTRSFETLSASDCDFSYRQSRFKRESGDWIITSVTFALGAAMPVVTGYASLAEELAKDPSIALDTPPDARRIARAVETVRRARLPDPALIGNAGSFFHNPIVDLETATRLHLRHPDLPCFPQPDGTVKLAAGWLIDVLGFKGARRGVRGAIGVHDRQALVLVNHGGGTSTELLALVEEIRNAVQQEFGIALTIEPEVI